MGGKREGKVRLKGAEERRKDWRWGGCEGRKGGRGGRHFILEHSATASWKRFKLAIHLDRLPLVMVRHWEGAIRKKGSKVSLRRWLSSTKYFSTYLGPEGTW